MPRKELTEEQKRIRNENLKKGREKIKQMNEEKKKKIKIAESVQSEHLEEFKSDPVKKKRAPKVKVVEEVVESEEEEEYEEPLLKKEIKPKEKSKQELLREKRELLKKMKEEHEYEQEEAELEAEMLKYSKKKKEVEQPAPLPHPSFVEIPTYDNPYTKYFQRSY